MRFAWLTLLLACAPPPDATGDGSPTDPDGGGAPTTPAPTDDASLTDTASPTDTAAADTGDTTSGDTADTAPPVDTSPPVPAPIVLAHGFFGFETFAGLDFATYFYGVKDRLNAAGEPLVFTPAVDPFANSTTRGDQLLAAVEDIVAQTGADKVNLVAHSQGGLDARRVASLRPDLVESVTTIATPHDGAPVADIVVGAVPYPFVQDVVDAIVVAVAGGLWDAADADTSLFESFEQLSSNGAAAFDFAHPDGPGVVYYSIGGRSDWSDGGSDCDAVNRPAFIRRWDGERDPVDLLLSLTESLSDGGLFRNDPNDGLVRVDRSKHGRFLGCIPADHFDEIGHLFGDGGGLGNDFDHLLFYQELVAFLRAQGH